MKQQQFIEQQHPLWEEFRHLAEQLEKPPRKRAPAELERLPALYRRLCADYALARHRHYGSALVDELHDLVQRGHRLLYRRKSLWLWRIMSFFWSGFPGTLRRHARAFWLATLLFYLPALAMGLACYSDADFIYTVLPPHEVSALEYMYDPGNEKVGRTEDRAASSDFLMFGYYIWNNIGIGFRTFASGMLAGVGTVFALLFNGVVIGAAAGHISQLGFTATFWPFVAGHSAFELTAICISGAAGLLLARAIIAPGRYSRSEALKHAALEAVVLVMGAAMLLLGAAFIEAFWSSNRAIDSTIKYGVSALLWLLLVLYLLFAGKSRHAA
ncbi:MAG TPA: stage II sporulation protein M [Gammaproteobacteria bacterium]